MLDLAVIRDIVAIASFIVALGYYIINIRNQRETRQAQLFMNIYNQSFNNQKYQDAQKIMMTWNWSSFTELMNTFFDSDKASENMEALWTLTGFYEGVGVLVREDLLHIRYVANLMTYWVTSFYEKFDPYIDELRAETYPRILSETEFLYRKLIEYIEKHSEIKK